MFVVMRRQSGYAVTYQGVDRFILTPDGDMTWEQARAEAQWMADEYEWAWNRGSVDWCRNPKAN